MSEPSPAAASWAREHGARYEVEPLIEMVEGRKTQVGFVLRVYALLPDVPAGERAAAAAPILARLREIVLSLQPAEGSAGRLELEPMRTAATLEAAGDLEPEISVSAQIFHSADYFAQVTEDDRKKVYAGAKRLVELGFGEGKRRR
jgi:hypothetical protein